MINTSHISQDMFYTNSIVCDVSHAPVCRDNTFVNTFVNRLLFCKPIMGFIMKSKWMWHSFLYHVTHFIHLLSTVTPQ